MDSRKSVSRWLLTAATVIASVASASFAQAQNAVITGKVTSAQGREIQGANVSIPELNISVVTNASGNYTILIPEARVTGSAAVLRVRSIGYLPKQTPVSITAGSHNADFSLTEDVNRLETVVTTGVIGATAQTKVPFSVTHLDSADMKVPAVNPLAQLAGKVPGANIVSASGRPGAAPAVLLRGPTAITGAGRGQQPIFIVDGVLLTNQGSSTGGGGIPDINPQDIESIEVLKGAAAASLYGAYAGNGVITIKTKTGIGSGDGVHLTARSEYGTSDIEHKILINPSHALELDETGTRFCIGPSSGASRFTCSQSIDYASEAYRINDRSLDFPLSPVGSFPVDPGSAVGGSDPVLRAGFLTRDWPGMNYDAVGQFVRPRPLVNNTLDMRGHYGNTSFYSSVSGLDQGGAIKYLNGFQRQTARLNLDQRIGSRWTASLTTFYARGQKDGWFQEDGGSAFFRLTRTVPIANLDAVDSHGRLFVRPNLGGGGTQNYNPLYLLQNDFQTSKTNHFTGGGTLRFAPTEWLDFDGNVDYDGSTTNLDNFRNKGYRINTGGTVAVGGDASRVWKAAEQLQSYNSGIGMNVTRELRSDLNSRTSLRYTFTRQDNDYRRVNGGILTVVGVPALANVQSSTLEANSNVESIRSIGYYLAQNLEFKDRYIIDALVRRDGSSLFGRANRWKTFGRGSVAWRVSQEPWYFMPVVNELKLRASVGTAGGRPGFTYQYETYTITNGVVSKSTLGNKDLKPESIRENEYGVDLEAFHRIGLTVNYAKSDSRDQILLVPVPVVTGFGQQWKNAGVLQNKTFEASLNVPIINRRDVQYSTRINYDRNRAVITHLYVPSFTFGATAQATDQIFLAREGERYGTFYGRAFATSCNQLPSQAAAACGHAGDPFQINSDGWVVWVGQGNTVNDGITSNLWMSRLPANSPFYATTGNGTAGLFNPSVAVNWGMPIIIRDSTGAAVQTPLGNPLPNYRWSLSQTLSYKRISVYGLLDAARGQHVYNQGRGWSYLDFLEGREDQKGRTVQTAKPLGYYYRAAAPDQSRLGGLYDILGPNNAVTEDASYVKLREVNVNFRLGQFGPSGGDWNLTLIGRNLHTWTRYTGFDPEVGFGAVSGAGSTTNGSGSAAINAIDAFQFPNLRTFTFSLSTSF